MSHAITPVSDIEDFPNEICTAAEIARDGEQTRLTPGGNAIVRPAANQEQILYLLETTMPSEACLGFANHYLHDGAMLWHVTSGEVEFWIAPIADHPMATLQVGTPPTDEHPLGQVETAVGTLAVTLKAGGWLSADSAVHYSFRSRGADESVILMTVLETSPQSQTGMTGDERWQVFMDCKGNCRNPRR